MDLTKYPIAADVQAELVSSKMWPTISGDQTTALVEVGIALDSTIGDWENRTGFTPFLSGAAATTRPFTMKNAQKYLPLQGGLVDTDNFPPVVEVQGRSMITNQNYWLRPTSAPGNGRPYTGIEFVIFGPWINWLVPNQVTVNGKWGFCIALPADVWAAIRSKAAAEAFQSNAAAWTPFITSETMPGGYEQTQSRPLSPKDRLQSWTDRFDKTVARYVRAV